MKSTDGGTSPLWAGPFLRSRSVWRRYRERKWASVHLFLSVPDCGWDVTTCIGSCCLAFPTAMESEPGPGAEINPLLLMLLCLLSRQGKQNQDTDRAFRIRNICRQKRSVISHF